MTNEQTKKMSNSDIIKAIELAVGALAHLHKAAGIKIQSKSLRLGTIRKNEKNLWEITVGYKIETDTTPANTLEMIYSNDFQEQKFTIDLAKEEVISVEKIS